jgi:hypothetical protein
MLNKLTFLVLLAIFLFINQNPIYANVLNVPSVTYPNIQSAIDSAQAGDTVLVQSGTYLENINFNSKNVHVGSLYLTTADPSYILETVIDGSGTGRVVTFENAEDSSAQLIGFTIRNGMTFSGGGGGIYCSNGSSPVLKNLHIRENSAANGGGIFCFEASPMIENCLIANNTTFSVGGGIYASKNSFLKIYESDILTNFANDEGGGIYMTDSSRIDLHNVALQGNISFSGAGIYLRRGSEVFLIDASVGNNYAEDFGGGIYSRSSDVSLISSIIESNEGIFGGGGLYLEQASHIRLVNTRILKNRTSFDGGGIFADNSTIVLRSSTLYENGAGGNGGAIYSVLAQLDVHQDSLSNIYTNFAGFDGGDLYFTTLNPISIQLDTFTVSDTNDYFIYPSDNINLTFNHAKLVQVENDLFVSLTGDNSNDGLSPTTPLRSISYALLKIVADSLNPNSIHIDNGSYTPLSNDEFYPLRLPPYVSLNGSSTALTILDAAYQDRIIVARKNKTSAIENLSLTGGYAEFGAGIYMSSAEISVKNVLITKNFGGFGSAMYCQDRSKPYLMHTTVVNNWINEDFFGIQSTAGIYCIDSDPVVINSIFWENEEEEIYLDQLNSTNNLVVIFSDIQDGLDAVSRAADDSVYWFDGNINSDPLFSDTTAGNFNLLEDSPCIDAGIEDTVFTYNNNADTIRVPALVFLGQAPDLGAFEFVLTAIMSASNNLPDTYRLYQNFPNPFNPNTKIRFSLPVSALVTLEIYNISGQRLETLVGDFKSAGTYEVLFNGEKYASGLYFCRLQAGTFERTVRMILLK